ncbi:MAG: alanine--tRNA ligase, partial [Actinobacteria bacterium]
IGEDWSKELCAGTHVETTGHIGRVTLVGEGSVGSGVRRLDALVGQGAYAFQAKEHALVSQLTTLVGGRADELPDRVESMLSKLKETERELEQARTAMALARAADIAHQAQRQGNALVAAEALGEMPSTDAIRSLALDIRDRLGNETAVIVALIGVVKGKPAVVVATNKTAQEQSYSAGALVRVASKVLGGGGGGRDDIAQGGGTDASAVDNAITALIQEIG